jgi:hypothetical protein
VSFDESKHPRGQAGNAGQFRDKEHSAPADTLLGPDYDGASHFSTERLDYLDGRVAAWETRQAALDAAAVAFIQTNTPEGIQDVHLAQSPDGDWLTIESFTLGGGETVSAEDVFEPKVSVRTAVRRGLREWFGALDDAASLISSPENAGLQVSGGKKRRVVLPTKGVRGKRGFTRVDQADLDTHIALTNEARNEKEAAAVHAIAELMPEECATVRLAPSDDGSTLAFAGFWDLDGVLHEPNESDIRTSLIDEAARHISSEPTTRGAGGAGLVPDVLFDSNNPHFVVSRQTVFA